MASKNSKHNYTVRDNFTNYKKKIQTYLEVNTFTKGGFKEKEA